MQYGRVSRAFTHKALNRRLQGGAADIMKAAIVALYEGGHFNDTGVPSLTVHDELDFEDEGDPDAAVWDDMRHVMETCLPCSVPILVSTGSGESWAAAD